MMTNVEQMARKIKECPKEVDYDSYIPFSPQSTASKVPKLRNLPKELL